MWLQVTVEKSFFFFFLDLSLVSDQVLSCLISCVVWFYGKRMFVIYIEEKGISSPQWFIFGGCYCDNSFKGHLNATYSLCICTKYVYVFHLFGLRAYLYFTVKPTRWRLNWDVICRVSCEQRFNGKRLICLLVIQKHVCIRFLMESRIWKPLYLTVMTNSCVFC